MYSIYTDQGYEAAEFRDEFAAFPVVPLFPRYEKKVREIYESYANAALQDIATRLIMMGIVSGSDVCTVISDQNNQREYAALHDRYADLARADERVTLTPAEKRTIKAQRLALTRQKDWPLFSRYVGIRISLRGKTVDCLAAGVARCYAVQSGGKYIHFRNIYAAIKIDAHKAI